MRFDGNAGAAPHYGPNSVPGTPAEAPAYREPSWDLGATAVERFSHRGEEDHFSQPGALFRLMTPVQQELLVATLSASLKAVTLPEIVQRQLGHCERVDARHAAGIRPRLELAC